MIYFGKELYLKDQLMPLNVERAQKELAILKKTLTWAIANEEPMWRKFH